MKFSFFLPLCPGGNWKESLKCQNIDPLLQRRNHWCKDKICFHAQQPMGPSQHSGEEGLADLLRGDLPLPVAAQVYQEKVTKISSIFSEWLHHAVRCSLIF